MATEDIDPEEVSTNIVNLDISLDDVDRYSRETCSAIEEHVALLDSRLDILYKQIAQLQNLAWETAKTRERLKQARVILFQINPDTQNHDMKEN